MWHKMFLILVLHAGANFDAWTTNQSYHATPPGLTYQEINPLVRSYAGGRGAYVVLNLELVPLDIWIASGKKPSAAKAVAGAWLGSQAYQSFRNLHRKRRLERDYRRDRETWPLWDGIYRNCPHGNGVNAAGCPIDPGW